VLGYEIPLPPLAEQRRIVAWIEALATKIAEARSLRQQAADEAEALIGARSAEIFREASRQGIAPLQSIAVLERGKFSHRPRNDPRFFGGSHPWIQIGEIESAGKEIRRWTETLNDEGLAISKKFPKGTVLISIAATIGSVGILAFDCCIPDSIVGVTPREGTDSEYLYYYLTYLRSHLEEIAPQSAQKNINLQILAPLPVPRLTLSEQCRIVAELDAMQAEVDALKRLQSETAAELNALLPTILDRAFKGEL
jgi:type I restriction enzyme, S subunit